MLYLMKAFQLGLQVMAAIQSVKLGQLATLAVEWKGVLYKLSLEQIKL